jgi:hypothetical protein
MDIDVIDLEPSETQEVSPTEFLRLYEDERDDIASVKIVPPVLGRRGFGRIVVTHKAPVYSYRGIKGVTFKRKRNKMAKLRAKVLRDKTNTAA